MITELKENKVDLILLINLVFCFFPISFILGNFITNINIVLFCILGILKLKSKIFVSQYNQSIKVILLFFIAIFLSTSISLLKSIYLEEYQQNDLERLIKAILFFRFFLFLIIIYLLHKENILNLKYFFLVAAFSSLFISLDVIYQNIFGFNIIGLENTLRINSSFFGDELIAGGYIQNFSFFAILLIPFLEYENKIIKQALTTAIIIIVGLGILLSGNRMPMLEFFLGLFFLVLFSNKLRKIILANIIILLLVFGFVASIDNNVKYNYRSLYGSIKNIVIILFKTSNDEAVSNKLEDKNKSLMDDFESFWTLQRQKSSDSVNVQSNIHGHSKLFATAIDTWSKNKVFGNGIKSFRKDCIKFHKRKKNRLCSNHPHNYYLEILTETGIVGIILIISLSFVFIIFFLKNRKIVENDLILLAAIIGLFSETFPIKSTGSIFTTSNATYVILIASMLLCYKKILFLKKN